MPCGICIVARCPFSAEEEWEHRATGIVQLRHLWIYDHRHFQIVFPTDSQYASLLLTAATFGAGFLMRLLGGILLELYEDLAEDERRRAAIGAATTPDTVANVAEEFIRRALAGRNRASSYVAATLRIFDDHMLPRCAKTKSPVTPGHRAAA
jgi:hypothetical protein